MYQATGPELKSLRECADLNLTQILQDCPIKGMDKPLLSKVENGIVNPTESLIKHYYCKCGKSIVDTAYALHTAVATAQNGINNRNESNALTDRLTRYNQILRVLDKPMTARQIAKAIGLTSRQDVAPRLTEMLDGEVEECGTAYDEITKRNVTVYRRAI